MMAQQRKIHGKERGQGIQGHAHCGRSTPDTAIIEYSSIGDDVAMRNITCIPCQNHIMEYVKHNLFNAFFLYSGPEDWIKEVKKFTRTVKNHWFRCR